MKFSIITLGCKLNQFESSAIGSRLIKMGLEYEEDYRNSNIVILNSCTVTDTADKKVMKYVKSIRRLKEERNIFFIFTGCLAQTDGDKISGMEGIDLVIDNKLKHKVPEVIKSFLENRFLDIKSIKPSRKGRFEFEPDSFLGRTRAFLKIQDGCNRMCSFCKVPFAREVVFLLSMMKLLEGLKNFLN